MTKEQAVKKVLDLARAEIGYREKNSASGLDDPEANAGSGNYTKYARDLDQIPGFYNGPKQAFPWCDCFYDWLVVKAFGPETAKKLLCQPDDSAGAGCYYSALYYRQAGRFRSISPEPGDQIFFTYQSGEVSHTGIVEAINFPGVVTTIEGNSSDSVCRRSYAIGSSTIYGYGRPDWTIVDDRPEPPPADDDPAPEPTHEADPGRPYIIKLRELKRGDNSIAVERVQTLLIGRGYYCGGRIFSGREQPDGDFGPATEAAVKDVQLAAGLEQDGVVGTATMLELLTK